MTESKSVILGITNPTPRSEAAGSIHQPLEAEPGREAAAGAEVLADQRGGTSRQEEVSEIIKLPDWQD
jgi:hypothetical protein